MANLNPTPNETLALVDGKLFTRQAWTYTVEASTAGLRPGLWPMAIAVQRDGKDPLLFLRHRKETNGNELVAVVYVNGPWVIRVLND